jgi:N-acetylglucosaminylphosphatidylinositol deacetylase
MIPQILTFDEHGISQHPNHISLPGGVSHLLRAPSAPVAKLFTLRTVPLLPKYTGPVSNPLTKLWLWLPRTSGDDQIYVAGVGGYLTALRAMYQHQSQLVWFRWLYVLFSRYMWVNEWVEVPIHRDGKELYIHA